MEQNRIQSSQRRSVERGISQLPNAAAAGKLRPGVPKKPSGSGASPSKGATTPASSKTFHRGKG